MSWTCKCLIVLLSLAAAQAADDKDKAKFTPGAVDSYAIRQTNESVTIAVDPFDTADKAHQAFGKLDPNEHSVLPVLVVIQNNRAQAVRLESLRFELITADREHVEATPAADLKYLQAPGGSKTSRIPGRGPQLQKRKNPFNAWEIEGRAFAAKMLPPKETASGFVYFQAPLEKGSRLYVTGLRDAASGKDLFYFEIPMEK